jgi:hypothetical protein
MRGSYAAADLPVESPFFAEGDLGLVESEAVAGVSPGLVDGEPEAGLCFVPPFEAYPSEYHPPPLRMKPAPPETMRRAVFFRHSGHLSRGGSLILWSASQSWPHAVH